MNFADRITCTKAFMYYMYANLIFADKSKYM